MATSTTAAPRGAADTQLVKRSSVLRGAWRDPDPQRLLPKVCGPRPGNRNSVFPNKKRSEKLACNIFCDGFDRKNAEFEAVCVREFPVKTLMSNEKKDYEQFSQWVQRECPEDLLPVFGGRNGGHLSTVTHGTLSHTHLLIILRAISYQVEWNVPTDLTEAELTLLRSKEGLITPAGKLAMGQMAVHDAVCNDLVRNGLLFEVLRPEMMDDDPTRASTIAQALNRPQDHAMRMSEIEACWCIATGIQLYRKRNGDSFDLNYQGVMQICGSQLGQFPSEPDFVEFFQFVVNLGGDEAPFLKEFRRFCEVCVDSQKVQMRLSCFKVVGALPLNCPRSKLALLMRAYRAAPQRRARGLAWAPDTEAAWGTKQGHWMLEDLEEVLVHHRVKEKAIVDSELEKAGKKLTHSTTTSASTSRTSRMES